MNAASTSEFHCLRVACALVSIVAGCIIILVSRDCGVNAVGGIFVGAGGLGLIISLYPFIKAWLNFNQILPMLGNFRIHPAPNNIQQPAETFQREEKKRYSAQPAAKRNYTRSLMQTRSDSANEDLYNSM
ncbi:kinocilin [Amia ocellicauda]|uniref:kinocilin n=1 Tax=Amia ocellicauda TaxID=2972642 RepID=UPI0034640996